MTSRSASGVLQADLAFAHEASSVRERKRALCSSKAGFCRLFLLPVLTHRASTNVGSQVTDGWDASVVRAHEPLPRNWSKSA